ncbi:MAG: DUF1097 domain-containing protein [Solirubrobacterales bacterium]|nr:DUF1097 domain-containing protein [Solirubrobacterales bacterium]
MRHTSLHTKPFSRGLIRQRMLAMAGERRVPSPRVAAAIAAAILAGLSVWTFAQSNHLLIWAAFIGWASYDVNGAGRSAVLVSTASLLFAWSWRGWSPSWSRRGRCPGPPRSPRPSRRRSHRF